MKNKARIILKSGADFFVVCDDLKISKSGNELVGMSWTACDENPPVYIRLDDVSAIIKVTEEE